MFLLTLFVNPARADSPPDASKEKQIAAVKAEMADAISRVKQIVNQPVTELRITPGMHYQIYHPGWFHPGAIKPNFATVDVRKTQELPYSQYQYVTSDLNPGVVFLGSELEFNSMTKYFYTNRSLPKKRLSEAEMIEINKLYRTIAHCQHQLLDLEHPVQKASLDTTRGTDKSQPPAPESSLTMMHRWIFTHKSAAAGIVAALFVLLLLVRAIRRWASVD